MVAYYMTAEGFQIECEGRKIAHLGPKDGWTKEMVDKLVEVCNDAAEWQPCEACEKRNAA